MAQDGASSSPGRDSGASLPFAIAVGLGEPGAYLPPLPDETLLLQRGCQGAQHVFTSIRARGPKGNLARVEIRVLRSRDGVLVSVPLDVKLPYEPDPFGERIKRISGLTPVIEVPGDVVGDVVEIRVSVTDDGGERAEGLVRGRVEWGPDSCGGH
ncbi:MAG: hypothetical protein U0183_07225 [Polyangiaceae bacterium]